MRASTVSHRALSLGLAVEPVSIGRLDDAREGIRQGQAQRRFRRPSPAELRRARFSGGGNIISREAKERRPKTARQTPMEFFQKAEKPNSPRSGRTHE